MMNRLTLSGPMLLRNGGIGEATLVIEHGLVARITPGLTLTADIVTEGCIAPGFIDLQVNGAFGADFTSDARTVADVAVRLPATGVTSFLPTIITSPFETYPKLTHDIRTANENASGAQALGVHLGGPYLNPFKHGAHTGHSRQRRAFERHFFGGDGGLRDRRQLGNAPVQRHERTQAPRAWR